MIKRVEHEDYEAYEKYVSQHPKGHFLQSLPWADFKKQQKHIALLSMDNTGFVRGAMLILVQKAPLFGSTLLYSPRGPVCDADNIDAMRELIDEAKKIAKENRAYILTLDPDVAEDSEFCRNLLACGMKKSDNNHDNGLLQPLAVFRIDITDKSDEDLLNMFHSKARYSVRSALKSGAICRLGSREDIPSFQALLVETASRDGFTPRGVSYFNDMFDALSPNYCKLFIVEYEGEMIAGSVLIRYGDKTWHLYGASGENHKDKLPNFLMQWEMMRWSIQNGCTVYDMRGVAGEQDKTKPLEGLMRFKKRFGGELIPFVGRLDVVYHPFVRWMIDSARGAKKALRGMIGKGR